jgi:hypothetical protein
MQIHHKPTKILIVGKSGSGKSTYQIRYVLNGNYDRIFIFDHKNEFEERMRVVPCYSLDECTESLKRGDRFVSYMYAEEFPGDSETAFQVYCEWCYEICKILNTDGKKSLFACDEVNRFTGTSEMGWSFRQLIEDGRLQGLDFCGTSHAANQIHNRLRLQLTEIVALRTHDPRPLAFLEENGFDVEEVKSLPIGSFVLKDLDHDIFKRGKLFSCATEDVVLEDQVQTESAEPENSSLESPENVIPSSSTDVATVHR